MTCPKCGLFSPSEAILCDCGHDFSRVPSVITDVLDAESVPTDRAMSCPICGLFNPAGTMQCDCGHALGVDLPAYLTADLARTHGADRLKGTFLTGRRIIWFVVGMVALRAVLFTSWRNDTGATLFVLCIAGLIALAMYYQWRRRPGR